MTNGNTILDSLRQRGYRITPQREYVVDIMANSRRHMSAEEIFKKLQTRTQVTNISTVYRSLDLLWKEGFALRNDLGENTIVYSIKEHGPHIHLVCRNCNLVIESKPDILTSLYEELNSEHGFKADLEHITIFGLCADCNQ